jgi:hypothetical protein
MPVGGSDRFGGIKDATKVHVVSASALMLSFARLRPQEPQVLQPAGDASLSTGRSAKIFAFHSSDEERESTSENVPHLLPQAETSILVEDFSDGRAKVTLTLPWSNAIEVLDLLKHHGFSHSLNA